MVTVVWRHVQKPTRKRMTFVNTTAIAYTKIMRLRPIFCLFARAAVFTNVRRLRVFNGVSDWILKVPVSEFRSVGIASGCLLG